MSDLEKLTLAAARRVRETRKAELVGYVYGCRLMVQPEPSEPVSVSHWGMVG